MQSDYHLQDLVFQTRELVVYRAFHKDGTPHAIIRLKFSDEILENLQKQDRFKKGLDELYNLHHSSLRPVVDGGLDSVDGNPWLAARWWEGTILSESEITQSEINRLRTQAEDLISALGYRAGALCFTPFEIVTATASDGQTVHTFSIDYFQWFRDWAIGYPPGEKNDPEQALNQLINSLTPAPRTSPLLAPPQTPAKPVEPSPSPAPLSLPIPKSSPLKPLALIGILLILIGSGIWWINRKPADSHPSQTLSADTNPTPETPQKPTSSPPHLTAISPKVEKPNASPQPKPETTITAAPRPEFEGEIYDIERPDDIITNQPIKDLYTLEDEEELRNMSRAIVSVQATVANFTKTKTGSSLYLVFHEEGPGFRAGVSAKKAEEGLDEDYLRSFVGKEIIVTGEVSVFEKASGGKGTRLVIRFSKKSDLKLVE